MRVKIVRQPAFGAADEALRVGRIYNLESSVASALLIEGYAELAEGFTDERGQASAEGGDVWQASDRPRRQRD